MHVIEHETCIGIEMPVQPDSDIVHFSTEIRRGAVIPAELWVDNPSHMWGSTLCPWPRELLLGRIKEAHRHLDLLLGEHYALLLGIRRL